MDDRYKAAFAQNSELLAEFLRKERVFRNDLKHYNCLTDQDVASIESSLTTRGNAKIRERAELSIKKIAEANTCKQFSLYLLYTNEDLAFQVFPFLKEERKMGFFQKEKRGCAPRLLSGAAANVLWIVACERDFQCVRTAFKCNTQSSIFKDVFKHCALSLPKVDEDNDIDERAQSVDDDPPPIASGIPVSLACPLKKLEEKSYHQLFDILTEFEPRPHIAVFTSVAPTTSAFSTMPGDVVMITTSDPQPKFAELEHLTELWQLEGRLKNDLSIKSFEEQTQISRPTKLNLDAYTARVRYGTASGHASTSTAAIASCEAVNFYEAARSVEGLTYIAAIGVNAEEGSDDYWANFAGFCTAGCMRHVIDYLVKTV